MILLLGSSGMLGRSFISALSGNGATAPAVLAPTHADLDVTNEVMVWKYFKTYRPICVVNCIAHTDVDDCEKDPKKAYLLNARIVQHIGQASKRFHAKFIQISTDYVFDGEKDVYREEDECNPLQVYGQTKLEGERLALEYKALVFRVQWLFGRGKKNFVTWVMETVGKGDAVQVSQTQIGCPTGTDWLARTILMAAQQKWSVHLSSST